MQLPFTLEQFLDVFEAYHRVMWPGAVILWLATAALLVLLLGRTHHHEPQHQQHRCHPHQRFHAAWTLLLPARLLGGIGRARGARASVAPFGRLRFALR